MISYFDSKKFEEILTIRAFEQSLLEMFKLGVIGGTVHTCIGQEINSVIISKFKKEGDFTLSNHRGHGHFLAFNDFHYESMLKEILGRNDGCSKGIGGSQHLSSSTFLSNGIQGGMTPIGAGISYAFKTKQKSETDNLNCVFVFIGDGTLGQGVLYESLNICGLLGLPIVFILEDNGIAQSTPTIHTLSGDLKSRIQGFGLTYYYFENIHDKIQNIENAVLNARRGQPQFIHINSLRLMSHSKGDDNRDPIHVETLKKDSWIEQTISESKDYQLFLNEKREFFIKEGLKFVSQAEYAKFSKPPFEKKQLSETNCHIEYSNERYNTRINKALQIFLEKNVKSIGLGEDIRDSTVFPCDKIQYGGAFRVTAGLSTMFPERLLNFPISEQLIVGFSTGHSLINGWTICEIMFADFLTLAVDQIIQHLAKFKLMLGEIHDPKVIIRTPIGGYRGYGPTHSQCLENLFIGIPNLNVVAANKYISPAFYFNYITELGLPTIFIENKILYTETSKQIDGFQHDLITEGVNSPLVLSKSLFLEAKCLIITYGQLISVVEEAAIDLLINEEIGLESICFSDLNDFDFSDKLINILKKYRHFLILTESKEVASWSSQIAFELYKKLKNITVDIIGNDWIVPASTNFEKIVLPSKSELIKWAKKHV